MFQTSVKLTGLVMWIKITFCSIQALSICQIRTWDIKLGEVNLGWLCLCAYENGWWCYFTWGVSAYIPMTSSLRSLQEWVLILVTYGIISIPNELWPPFSYEIIKDGCELERGQFRLHACRIIVYRTCVTIDCVVRLGLHVSWCLWGVVSGG
jgi:hypothetical protein